MLSRLSVLFAALLLLASCGFTPQYGTGNRNAASELSAVDIGLIPDANGVYLRNILIDQFYQDGYPKSPRYALSVGQISEAISDLDITVDSDATRKQVRLQTVMTLTDRQSGNVLLTRNLRALTSYNVLDSQFTTRISEQDAKEAALADLARQIEVQVMSVLGRN